jgi:predicted N-acetyltransferase YhbS
VLAFYDVRGRADGEGDHDTAILLDCHDRGGWLPGMLDDARLVAAVAVDTRPLGTGRDKRQLKFLHVSRDWRGRGLCESLCRTAGPHARSRGAEHLYCTPATQSQRTTDFHRRPGFTVGESPDSTRRLTRSSRTTSI